MKGEVEDALVSAELRNSGRAEIPSGEIGEMVMDRLRVLDEVAKLLPVAGAKYEEDTLTDRPVRFFAGEFVREQILGFAREEIPHAPDLSLIGTATARPNLKILEQLGLDHAPRFVCRAEHQSARLA